MNLSGLGKQDGTAQGFCWVSERSPPGLEGVCLFSCPDSLSCSLCLCLFPCVLSHHRLSGSPAFLANTCGVHQWHLWVESLGAGAQIHLTTGQNPEGCGNLWHSYTFLRLAFSLACGHVVAFENVWDNMESKFVYMRVNACHASHKTWRTSHLPVSEVSCLLLLLRKTCWSRQAVFWYCMSRYSDK